MTIGYGSLYSSSLSLPLIHYSFRMLSFFQVVFLLKLSALPLFYSLLSNLYVVYCLIVLFLGFFLPGNEHKADKKGRRKGIFSLFSLLFFFSSLGFQGHNKEPRWFCLGKGLWFVLSF